MDSINEKGCVIFVSATSTLFDMIFMKMEVWINDISRVTRQIKTLFHNERRGEAELQVMKYLDLPSHEL